MKKNKTREAFTNVKKDVDNLRERIAVLETQSQSSLTKSQAVSGSLTKSQNKIETKIINRIRRSKKKAVIFEIKKLLPSTTIQDIKIILVDEKGLCSKASFYRYIHSLKSQKLIETETGLRLSETELRLRNK